MKHNPTALHCKCDACTVSWPGAMGEFLKTSPNPLINLGKKLTTPSPEAPAYLVYTEGCHMKVKKFKSKQFRKDFIADFALISQGTEDNSIDMLIDGEVRVIEGSGLIPEEEDEACLK